MQVLNFLLSSTMVEIYLAAITVILLFKMAKELDFDPNEVPEPLEDIEGHIAGINNADSPDQVINSYQQGKAYNSLRSEAFVSKMADFHQDAAG